MPTRVNPSRAERITNWGVLAMMAVLTGAGCAAKEQPPDGNDRSPKMIKLEPYAGRLVTVAAQIGDVPVKLLFDSGGGQTIISPDVADSIGCTPEGRDVGFRMSGERVEWSLCENAHLTLADEETEMSVAVWDIMSVLPPELPPLDGVLSLDVFRDLLTLDLANSALWIETPASLSIRKQDMKSVPMRIATGTNGAHLTVFLNVGVDDEQAWMLLDSANLGPTLAAARYTSSAEPAVHPLSFGDSVVVESMIHPTEEIIYDGVISESVMREVLIAMDLSASLAWVKHAAPDLESHE